MSAAKKGPAPPPASEADLRERMARLAETLPAEPEPPKPKPPGTDVIPFVDNPTTKARAAAAREKFKPIPVLSTLGDMAPERFSWLWPGRFPEDRVSVLMGESGAGKSTFWTWFASVVTTGGRWPDGSRCGKRGSVLVLQSEEVPSQEIRDRVTRFGGDLDKVHFLDGVIRDGGEMTTTSLANDVPAIDAALDQLGDVALVVVDPLGEFTEGISGFGENDVRRMLRPLRRLAERRKVAILLAAHMNKDWEKDITQRLIGSVAFLAISRMTWYLCEDPFDPSRRCLSLVKGNPTDKTETGLVYGLDPRGPVWCDEPVRMDARQIDNALQAVRRKCKAIQGPKGPPPTKTKMAMDLILASLASGPQLQSAVIAELVKAGVSQAQAREAVKRLTGASDGGEVFIVRDKTDPAGAKSEAIWLRLVGRVVPRLLADVVTGPDPLDSWLDDGGSPGRSAE